MNKSIFALDGSFEDSQFDLNNSNDGSFNTDDVSKTPPKRKRGRPPGSRKRKPSTPIDIAIEEKFKANNMNKEPEDKNLEEETSVEVLSTSNESLLKSKDFVHSNRSELDNLEPFVNHVLDINPEILIHQNNKSHVPHQKPFKNFDDVIGWLEMNKHIGLRVGEIDVVCLDVDNINLIPHIYAILEFLEIRTLVTTSPRGAHFFFYFNKVWGGREPRGSILLSGGFECEIRTTFVTFIGAGYNIVSTIQPLFSEKCLPDFPYIFYPLQTKRRKVTPLVSEKNGYSIYEGERNDTLFAWACELWRSENPDPRTVIAAINNAFCQPPLAETEIEDLVISARNQVKPDFEKKKPLISGRLVQIMIDKYGNDLFYSPITKSWYKWEELRWRLLGPLEIQDLVRQEIDLYDSSMKKMSLINDTVSLLEIDLKRDLNEPPETLINFRNGVLDTRTLQLLEHHPSYSFTHFIDTDFDPNAYPSEDLQRLLLFLVDGNTFNLEMLRAAIRRSLEPTYYFQTGLWIYGPPGTGKSSFIDWLRTILKDQTVELSCERINLFERARIRGKSVLIVSDGEAINTVTGRILKMVSGRDEIAFDIKFENVLVPYFRSKAVIFVASNLSLANAMVNAHDPALFDRFFPIPFPNIPVSPQASMSNFLLANTSALINWAMTTSKESLMCQIRVGKYANESYADDPYVDFITSYLIDDRQGFLSNGDLIELLDTHFKANGLIPLTGRIRQRVPSLISAILTNVFSCAIDPKARRKRVRGIGGIRKLEMETEEAISLPVNISRPVFDPFKKNEIVPYSEIGQTFDASILEKKQPIPKKEKISKDPITESESESSEGHSTEGGETSVEAPSTASLESLISSALKTWWSFKDLSLGDLYEYSPWTLYRSEETVSKAYEAVMRMPNCWKQLLRRLEDLQAPEVRDTIYINLQALDKRERSWYTCKRQHGIIGFLFPIKYQRCDGAYPRLKPIGSTQSKLGLLGVHKSFRKAILGDLNLRIKLEGAPYKIVEVDLVSCHMKIMADLRLKTPILSDLMQRGGNIWEEIIASLPTKIKEEFEFNFLKAESKRLGYKCLQGGRIDTTEKIYKTIKGDEKQVGKNLRYLAESFMSNQLLQEVDKLNSEIIERKERIGVTSVYTPMDSRPYQLVDKEELFWSTKNPCRVASQIVTGVEMLQILTILEGVRVLQLEWVPISLHHDGCALLVKKDTYEASQLKLEDYVKERLKPTLMVPTGLEFTDYEEYRVNKEEISEYSDLMSDNRLA